MCLRFLIGFVCLKTIMGAPKQLIRNVTELREGNNKYNEKVIGLSERDRQNVLGETVHFTSTITRGVDMGCNVRFDGVKSFSSLWILSSDAVEMIKWAFKMPLTSDRQTASLKRFLSLPVSNEA